MSSIAPFQEDSFPSQGQEVLLAELSRSSSRRSVAHEAIVGVDIVSISSSVTKQIFQI